MLSLRLESPTDHVVHSFSDSPAFTHAGRGESTAIALRASKKGTVAIFLAALCYAILFYCINF